MCVLFVCVHRVTALLIFLMYIVMMRSSFFVLHYTLWISLSLSLSFSSVTLYLSLTRHIYLSWAVCVCWFVVVFFLPLRFVGRSVYSSIILYILYVCLFEAHCTVVPTQPYCTHFRFPARVCDVILLTNWCWKIRFTLFVFHIY